MALRWTTTDQASLNQGVKMLVYGPAGAGKTGLCATLPSPVIISAEAGLLRLRQHRIPAIQISTIEELKEAYDWCAGSAEARQFASIGIDSISEIGEVVLAKAKSMVKDPRQAYGELIEKMEMIVRMFRDLPQKHIYVSAKMEPLKDEASGLVKYGPSMPGSKLGNNLPYFFDEVFRIGVNRDQQGNPYTFLQTQADIQYVAKDRSGALAAMEPPDLNHVISKILTGVNPQ